MIEENRTIEEIVLEGYNEEVVNKIKNKIKNSEYKRKLPVIAKLNSKTVDLENETGGVN